MPRGWQIQWFHLHKGNPNFPIVLNALNDFAVAEFLADRLSFLGIYNFIEAGLEQFLWQIPPHALVTHSCESAKLSR